MLKGPNFFWLKVAGLFSYRMWERAQGNLEVNLHMFCTQGTKDQRV